MAGSESKPEGELVKKYIEKYLDDLNDKSEPLGKKTLARIIVRDNPDLFTEDDVDNVRRMIRYYTGQGGERQRKNKIIDAPPAHRGKAQTRGKSIPESHARRHKPFQIEGKRIGIISDVHIPYHDPAAICAALDYFQKKEVDTILMNGDILDFWKISRFLKKGNKPDLVEEIEAGREFLEWLRWQFPEARIYYKLGNHEARWELYLWEKAGEMAKALEMEFGQSLGFAHFLHLEEHGITYIPDNQQIKAGKLNIIHGHEFGGSFFNPVNAARGLFMRAKASVLAGHNHQTSEHQEGNINGDAIACWSTGCLCELAPEYRPFAFTKWNLGAAWVEVYEDGSFMVDNFRIIEDADGLYSIR